LHLGGASRGRGHLGAAPFRRRFVVPGRLRPCRTPERPEHDILHSRLVGISGSGGTRPVPAGRARPGPRLPPPGGPVPIRLRPGLCRQSGCGGREPVGRDGRRAPDVPEGGEPEPRRRARAAVLRWLRGGQRPSRERQPGFRGPDVPRRLRRRRRRRLPQRARQDGGTDARSGGAGLLPADTQRSRQRLPSVGRGLSLRFRPRRG
jgi:hypothetical protein